MMGRNNDDTTLGTLRLEETFEQIHTAAVEDAVGLIEKQKLRLQQLPLGDRQTAFHAAGKIGDIFTGTLGQIDGVELRDDGVIVVVVIVE